MKQNILDFVDRLAVTDASGFGGLSIVGFCFRKDDSEGGSGGDLVLDEAIRDGLVDVREAKGGGHVPELLVTNRSDRRVFMMDGEQLIGAKQNRILNTSILIESRSTITIPVSCMEQGRWHSRSRTMDTGEISNPGLRTAKAAQVSANLEQHASFAADQGAIWNSVHEKIDRYHVEAPTGDFGRVYEHVRRDLDSYVKELSYVPGAVGVAAFIGGRLTCADVFDSSVTCRKLWKKLVSSYALDAIDSGAAGTPLPADYETQVLKFLRSPGSARLSPFDSPGLGTDLRFEGHALRGAALCVEDRVVHMALFNVHPTDERDWRPLTRPSLRGR